VISISQRCQYGLRALFELAKRPPGRPTTTGEIAEAQAIPPRFLESILNTLKQAKIVKSHRGARGGYILAVPPAELTMGMVISLLEGPIQPVKCIVGGGVDCPLRGKCSFLEVWQKAGSAMQDIFDSTTYQDLVDKEASAPAKCSAIYDI
jgi:Rrf2 family transcriptional regulator, cysteine metabolism repressor